MQQSNYPQLIIRAINLVSHKRQLWVDLVPSLPIDHRYYVPKFCPIGQ